MVLFVFGYFFPAVTVFAKAGLFILVLVSVVDTLLLFRTRRGVFGVRETGDRFSNGDDNDVHITLENFYKVPIRAVVIDELPPQLQLRDQRFQMALPPSSKKTFTYSVRPTHRGVYEFGALNIYVTSTLRLVSRRFKFDQQKQVAVYPSYIQMRKYELLAISHNLAEAGIKRVRRVGHTLEFDRIREYVQGDDYRTINWKATARRNDFMVNEYQDERSQQIYSVIDKGRVMKMPFKGMSLLDYAINASLVISNIAIRKQDKAGIVTFSHTLDTVVPADRKTSQMLKILEVLYRQKTQFLESNFELLYATLKQKMRHRSLILLFTNFETLASMKRQLDYLRKIGFNHLLVVVFFENTELKQLLDKPTKTTEDIYLKTIAEKFVFEKRQIVKELERYGIHSILTAPQNLTVNSINKYLELKARGLI